MGSLPKMIAILTSATAKPLIEARLRDFLLRHSHRVIVEVIALPIHSIAGYRAEALARLAERTPGLLDKLRDYDIVVVPGTVEGDVSVLEALISKPLVVKGPRSPALVGNALSLIIEGVALSKVSPLEDYVFSLGGGVEFREAFRLRSLAVPLRGPPVILASEIPHTCPELMLEREVKRVDSEGAEVIVIGASYETKPEELAERISKARLHTVKPIIAEAPSVDHALHASRAGAEGVIVGVETAMALAEDSRVDRELLVIVGDRSVERLESVAGRLSESGFTKIALDPVLGVPLFDLSASIERYVRLGRLDRPLVFSASNVLDGIPADTHGAQALLAMLALELGASIYSVVDEPGKLAHSTAEAREAIRVAQAIRAGGRVEEASRLFVIKSPVKQVSEKPLYDVEEVGYIEPRWDERGYVRIQVEPREGSIAAYYIEHSGRVYGVKGKHALSIARALVRMTGMDAEHAAYLGYELAKAEIAVKLSKPYIQDEEVIKTPWSSD